MWIYWGNRMVNLVHFLKIFHFSTWCPICGRSRLHSTGGLHMPGNCPTAMSRTSFCIVFLKSILGLFIWLYSPPLWLCAVTFHWASLPSTLQVHVRQTIFSYTQAAAGVIRGESNLSGVLQDWKEITSQQYLQVHSSQTPSHCKTSRWWLCDLYVACFELLSNGPYKATPFYATTLCLEYKRNVLDKGKSV